MNRSAGSIATRALEGIRPERVIVLEWHDGPVDGFLEFKSLATAWRFQLLADRVDSEDVDDRIYILSETSLELWGRLVALVGDYHEVSRKMWVPSWCFESSAIQAEADGLVTQLNENSGPAELLIRATGLQDVADIWMIRRGALGKESSAY